jgi:hypothetical protein
MVEGYQSWLSPHFRRSFRICQIRCSVMPKTSANVATDSPFRYLARISALRAHLGEVPSGTGNRGSSKPRYEIAIANATANKTWGNDLPRIPLWGTMGQIIPLLERKGNPAQNVGNKLNVQFVILSLPVSHPRPIPSTVFARCRKLIRRAQNSLRSRTLIGRYHSVY